VVSIHVENRCPNGFSNLCAVEPCPGIHRGGGEPYLVITDDMHHASRTVVL
jgi:hypothetical protein